MSDKTVEHAKKRAWWWNLYYHCLLYLHILLGVAGIIVGALIAAGSSISLSAAQISALGVLSTVIVGVVSFLQPGRMAGAFYASYWRMDMAILRSEGSTTAKTDLIDAMSDGYARIATVQPEALRKERAEGTTINIADLSKEGRAQVKEALKTIQDREALAKPVPKTDAEDPKKAGPQ